MKLRSLSAVLLTFLLVLALVVPALATTQATFTSTGAGANISGTGNNGAISGFAGEFNITLTGGQVVVGFCIDAHTGINTGDGGLEEQSWTGSGIANLNKVSWILNNYNSSNQTVTGVTLPGTGNQRAAAVQAAIWHYTDGFALDASFTGGAIQLGMDAILAAVPAGGLPIDAPPSLSLTPLTQTVETGTSASVTVNHNASSPVTVTDSQGNSYAGLNDGDTVSVTAASPTTITLSVTADVTVAQGRVFEHPTRTLQRLIIAESSIASSTASASVTFVDAEVTLDLDKTWDVPQGYGIDTDDFELSFFESDGQTPVTLPLTVDPGTQVDLVEKVTYVGDEELTELCTFVEEQSVSHTTAPFSQWTPDEQANGSRSESFAVTNVITCEPGRVELTVEKEWTLPDEYVAAELVSAEDFVVAFSIDGEPVDGPVSVAPGSTVTITESVSLADGVVLPESCTFAESGTFEFSVPVFAEWTSEEQQAGVAARTFTAMNTLECGPQVELTVDKEWTLPDEYVAAELVSAEDFVVAFSIDGVVVDGPVSVAPGSTVTITESVSLADGRELPATCEFEPTSEFSFDAPPFDQWTPQEQQAGVAARSFTAMNTLECGPQVELTVDKEWTLPDEYVAAELVSAEDFVVAFSIDGVVVDGPVSVAPGSTVTITESVSLADDVVLPESCTFAESGTFEFSAPAFADWTSEEQQAGVAARTFTAMNTLECGPQVELTVIKLWEETDLVDVDGLDVTFTYTGSASGSYVPGPDATPIRLAPGDVITFEEIVEGLPETCTWIGPGDEELVYAAPAFGDWDEDAQRAGTRSDELELTNRVVCDPIIPPPPPPAPNPSIDLVKVANPTTIELGEGEDATGTVTYTYTATNTGNRILNDVTIVDDVLGDLTAQLRAALGGSSLAVGASVSFSVTQTVGVDDIGTLVNVAIVTGTAPDGTPVSAEDDAEVEITQVLGEVIERPDPDEPVEDPVDGPADDPADDPTEIVDERETTEVLDVVVERTPRTGGETGLLILVGLLLAALGAAALGLGRRYDVG